MGHNTVAAKVAIFLFSGERRLPTKTRRFAKFAAAIGVSEDATPPPRAQGRCFVCPLASRPPGLFACSVTYSSDCLPIHDGERLTPDHRVVRRAGFRSVRRRYWSSFIFYF